MDKKETKRYCQVLDLLPNEKSIEEYKRLHSKECNWKVVREGIKAVGILEMELYLKGNLVIMVVETPLDFDWDTAMAKLAEMPMQKEWEDTVAAFQKCSRGLSSSEKWSMCERIFYLYD